MPIETETPIRVLLTDDEVEYIDSIAKALRRRGIVTRAAHSGEAALAILATEEFDVIVLDLRMPGIDGLETLEAIRTRDPVTPVLLLSGHADLERVAAALRSGAADCLLKPCPVETLVSAIEDAAERKAITQEAQTRRPP